MAEDNARAARELPQSKACTKCERDQPLTEFYQGDGRFGRVARCRTCMNAAGAAYRRTHPDRAKASRDRYRFANPEKVAASTEKHRSENMERIRERDRAWRSANPDKCREASKRCRSAKPDEHNRRAIEWRRRNPEKARATQRRWQAAHKHDIGRRLTNSLRSSMCRAVAKGFKRRARTFELLGYSLEDLKAHLEHLFRPGMCWDNYGEWHIDHIIPLAALRYASPDDPNFRTAWALSNLQPLWALENQRKHAALPEGWVG